MAGAEDWRLTAVAAQDERLEVRATLIVCPIVRGALMQGIPLRLRLPRGVTGVGRPAEVAIDEILTIDTAAVRQVIGRLTRPQLSALEDGLLIALGLLPRVIVLAGLQ